jgi:hypothetical protein
MEDVSPKDKIIVYVYSLLQAGLLLGFIVYLQCYGPNRSREKYGE